MRILHVITSLRIGGAERLMVDLLPRLRNLGHEVALCVFDGIKTVFYHELENSGIKIYALREGGSVYDLRNIGALGCIMKSYDVVHTHNTAPQLFAAIAGLICPNVALITTEHNTSNRRRDKWYLKPGDLWMYKQYKNIICISEQARLNLVNYIGDSSKVCTVYNGIDLSRFQHAYHFLAQEDGTKVITMVAAFREQKDHKTLIKAFDLLPDNYRLQFVGDGELRKETECFAKQYSSVDRIAFMGNRNDVAQILSGSDVIVLSSYYEGLSLSSLEGMACGRPFIASDVDGLHEIVAGYGILFPQGDFLGLRDALLKVCEDCDYSEKVANKCQQRASQYDISIMVEKYNSIYAL